MTVLTSWHAAVAARFRGAGYPLAALLTSTQTYRFSGPDGAGLVIAAIGLCLAPLLYRRLPPRRAPIECGATAALLGWTAVPLELGLAVLGVLVVALTARDGKAVGLKCAVCSVCCGSAALWASPLPLLEGGPTLGATCVLFVVVLSAPVAVMARTAVQRQSGENARLRRETDGLGRVAATLASYLPEPVGPRLLAMELEPVLERRWVTACFVDLAGFTGLVDRLAPESVVALVRDFSSTMAKLARQHEGVFDKLMGDGVLLFFVGSADDLGPETAACACVSLLGELGESLITLEKRWRRLGMEQPLAVRAGVASGYCTVGDIGDADRRHYTVVGGPVNLADRFQRRAAPDSALLDATTADLVGSDVPGVDGALVPVGTVRVKGFSRGLVAFSLPLRLETRRRTALLPTIC